MSGQSKRKFLIEIICSSVDKNISFYKYISEKIIYYKQVALLIQCKLMEKVDLKSLL